MPSHPATIPDEQLKRHQLKRHVQGRLCRCQHSKRANYPFCGGCYSSIPLDPPELREGLRLKIGEGFEAAYERCCLILDRSDWTPPPTEAA